MSLFYVYGALSLRNTSNKKLITGDAYFGEEKKRGGGDFFPCMNYDLFIVKRILVKFLI